MHGASDIEKAERWHAAIDRNLDFLPLAQPLPLLAGQVDPAGTNGQASPIPAFGHFRPLALEDLSQCYIYYSLEPPLLGVEGKGKTIGIDIKRFQ
ncbi:hypothetical protein D3C72_1633850 [compost metagenome]